MHFKTEASITDSLTTRSTKMNKPTNTVAIEINQDKLLANLAFSFSNKSTILGELMQNARRSGATKVDFIVKNEGELIVNDDGKGIDNFQNLFSVADSGWDADTIKNERPFGMGWLSCLYGAEHIRVNSNGRYIKGFSAEILAGGALEVKNILPHFFSETITYTEVELSGFNMTVEQIKNSLAALASGFAIPVSLNGEYFSQKHALSNEDCKNLFQAVDGVGHILAPLHSKTNEHEKFVSNVVYLQGLPVYDARRWPQSTANIIHLDALTHFARMPDRDKLINEGEVLNKIKAAVNQLHLDKLIGYKKTLTPEEFAGQNIAKYALNINGGFAVLCEEDSRLSNYFYGMTGHNQPNCSDGYAEVDYDFSDNSLSFDMLASKQVHVCYIKSMDEYADTSYATGWIFAKKMGWYVVNAATFNNDAVCEAGIEKHWAFQFMHELSSENLENVVVEVINKTKSGQISLDYWNSACDVILCESYKLTFTAKTGDVYSVIVDDYPLYTADGELLVPKNVHSDNVGIQSVMQGSAYMENDTFDEVARDAGATALSLYVEMLRSGDETKALQSLLNTVSLGEYSDFIGQKYELTLNKYCNVVLTKMAA